MARGWERVLCQDTLRMISSRRNASPFPKSFFNSEQYLEILKKQKSRIKLREKNTKKQCQTTRNEDRSKGDEMEIIKQVIGIDIAKDTFVCRIGIIFINQSIEISSSKEFENTKKGIQAFHAYAKGRKIKGIPQRYLMEATGVYYEALAYYLHAKSEFVIVILPNKTKAFAKTLAIKSKTDSIDAQILTQMGLEKILDKWAPPSDLMKTLKSLTREHLEIKSSKVQAQNRMHAKSFSFKPGKDALRRLRKEIAFYNQLIKEIESSILDLLKSDEQIWRKVENINQVKGYGIMSIAKILAETNGFALFRNHKQLASYAGLDVVLRESGHFKGKTKISKKGNSHLRMGLYMPALSATRSNPKMKAFYDRIIAKGKPKKVGIIAVARKLLVLMYFLWTKDIEYISNYNHQSIAHS